MLLRDIRQVPEKGNHCILGHSFTYIVEKCPETGLFVGYVPGFPGAHSQAETLEELHRNMGDVIAMLLEDGPPCLETVFVGTQNILVT